MAATWNESSIPAQDGRTVVITGANSGLGLEAARMLAQHGARVVMTARDQAKGAAALATVKAAAPGAQVETRVLDLADLDSVRAFANGLLDDKVPVDVLLNNAGVMMTPQRTTKQGFELQFGTNHLGHFALTGLLFDALKAGNDPRVVTVSSGLHKAGSIDFDDLMREKSYTPTAAYAQSKFANILFGLELQRRVEAAGLPVRSLMAHPGYSSTNLQTSGPTGPMKFAMRIGNVLLAQSAAMGALGEVRAAVDPGVAGGQYYGPTGLAENRGHPGLVLPKKEAQDPEAARKLWEASEELTGVKYTF
jgi:NAD(P)-dependent dehydrogenase (short-subunit alcohol dehydrogenase family)